MATIARFQLEEILKEVDFQIKRLKTQIALNPKCPPGIKQSFIRMTLLYKTLKQTAKDGSLTVVDASIDEVVDEVLSEFTSRA